MNLPEKRDLSEEKALKSRQYYELLKLADGNVMPDPFELDNWLCEKDAMSKWPKTTLIDMTTYLLTVEDRELGQRLMTDYKVSDVVIKEIKRAQTKRILCTQHV